MVNIFSENFEHMFTSILVHIWVKKKILKVPPELNIEWRVHLNILSFRGILMHCTVRNWVRYRVRVAYGKFSPVCVNFTRNRSTYFPKTSLIFLQAFSYTFESKKTTRKFLKYFQNWTWKKVCIWMFRHFETWR